MRLRRYFLTGLAFSVQFALAAPLAYMLVAYGLTSGLMQAYPKWMLIGVIGFACVMVVLIPAAFAVKEWRSNAGA